MIKRFLVFLFIVLPVAAHAQQAKLETESVGSTTKGQVIMGVMNDNRSTRCTTEDKHCIPSVDDEGAWVLQGKVDTATKSFQIVDYAHHEIHSGSSFATHYNNDATNIGEMTVIAFNTADSTKWVHLLVEASVTAAAYVAIYETTSIDVDEGADLTIYNHNRNSATTSAISTIETSPEAGKATSFNETQAAGANITTTTELWREYLGAGEKVSASGGASRGESEFVLKQNTQYAIMIVSTTADDNTHNLVLSWYEHTNAS